MEKRFFNNWRIGLIGVFTLAILTYLPSLMGAAVWDDDDLITGQAVGGGTLQGAFTNPFLGHYFRPLTSASFVVDSSFALGTPIFYHQTNILLHALTAVLLAWFVVTLTEKRLAGILAGVFFALQPVQVGATAWIGGRTDVLSCFFIAGCMATLACYYRSNRYAWLIVSALALLLAALTKEQAIAFFPAVPLSVFALGSKKWRDAVKVSIPYLVSVLVFGYLWFLYCPPLRTSPFHLVETTQLALLTAADYTVALFFPTRASEMTYTVENFRTLWGLLLGGAAVLASVWLFSRLWRQNRTIAWLMICSLLVYIPVSNFPPVPSFVVAPYRMALAGTALAATFGILAAYAFTGRKYVIAGALAINLFVGAGVTWWSMHRWLTPHDIFNSVAETDNKFMVGMGNYSHVLDIEGNYKAALPCTDNLLAWLFGTKDWIGLIRTKGHAAATPAVIRRLASNSGIPDPMLLGWFLGCHASTLSHMHRDAEAKEITKDALVFAPLDPRLNFGYGQLIIGDKGMRGEALHHWEVAMAMSPNYSACAISLAHERIKDGHYTDAIQLLEPALGRNPWNTSGWMDLANAKVALRDFNGALAALDKAKGGIFANQATIEKRRQQVLAARSKA